MTNLINNTICYGNKKQVLIIFNCDTDNLTIHIKDSGAGIPEEFIDKVFRPFYRLEKSRNSKTGGGGLGLAIVRQLSNLHNWDIQIKRRKSTGTNVIFTISNLDHCIK